MEVAFEIPSLYMYFRSEVVSTSGPAILYSGGRPMSVNVGGGTGPSGVVASMNVVVGNVMTSY